MPSLRLMPLLACLVLLGKDASAQNCQSCGQPLQVQFPSTAFVEQTTEFVIPAVIKPLVQCDGPFQSPSYAPSGYQQYPQQIVVTGDNNDDDDLSLLYYILLLRNKGGFGGCGGGCGGGCRGGCGGGCGGSCGGGYSGYNIPFPQWFPGFPYGGSDYYGGDPETFDVSISC